MDGSLRWYFQEKKDTKLLHKMDDGCVRTLGHDDKGFMNLWR